eukprot:GHVT01096291.1.p1 GENE.GHVT01096291.1~~GHVT01096291.1.p1  ORF type:complete len:138 (-),score=5.58 GHVT01096291.1:558-971(-)
MFLFPPTSNGLRQIRDRRTWQQLTCNINQKTRKRLYKPNSEKINITSQNTQVPLNLFKTNMQTFSRLFSSRRLIFWHAPVVLCLNFYTFWIVFYLFVGTRIHTFPEGGLGQFIFRHITRVKQYSPSRELLRHGGPDT